jgi:cell division protein FtsA
LLNGGVILTGGGSQLKHLIQLTEYVTGLNARIGYPNEHLAAGHIEELANPMYATCIGLILKGQHVYESSLNGIINPEKEVVIVDTEVAEPVQVEERTTKKDVIYRHKSEKGRMTLKQFIDGMKSNIIDLFQEVDDKKFQYFLLNPLIISAYDSL